MAHQDLLAEAPSDFPRDLVDKYDPSDVLHEVVERSAEVAGVAGAGVSLLVGDALAFAMALNESIATVERAQEEARRGPCIDAHHTGQPVVVADLARFAERWPEVVAAANEVGIRAVVAIPMYLDGKTVGVLDLYDTVAREWSDEDLRIDRWLAEMAMACIVLHSRLQSAEIAAAQLQHALKSRVIIEQAKGMLAADHRISVDEAFELLRRHSKNHNVPLHEVASEVVKGRLRIRRRASRSPEQRPDEHQPQETRPSDRSSR